MTRRTKLALFISLFVLIFTYLALWAYSASWFKQEIDNLYAHADKDGIEFLGPKPTLTNFPFVPVVTYTNGIKAGNAQIVFQKLELRGYPIPFTTLTLDFPLGISLAGIADPKIWSLNQLRAEIAIPYHLPAAFTKEDLTAWKETGGKIEVRDYLLVKESLNSTGNGLLELDENLQPVFYLESVIHNYEAFIAEQKDQGLIDPFASAVGATILNGLAKTDEKTHEKTVTLKVSVKNRLLSVGPLQVLDLPEIAWDTRN